TMVDMLKCYNLYAAVRYVVEAGLEGDFVECGVWRGGCCMLMASILQGRGVTDRDIHLYDTFAGMTRPTAHDRKFTGQDAQPTWEQQQAHDHNAWCYAPLDDVKANLASTGYPQDRLHFIKGPVQETMPGHVPERIAIL